MTDQFSTPPETAPHPHPTADTRPVVDAQQPGGADRSDRIGAGGAATGSAEGGGVGEGALGSGAAASRDIAEVPSVEIISTAALHLMSAAAVHLGLAEDLPDHKDLDEARSLITALAGLLDASAQTLGHHHAAPLRDGLRSLQLAFQEASTIPDEPGQGPGEKYTGPVHPTTRRR